MALIKRFSFKKICEKEEKRDAAEKPLTKERAESATSANQCPPKRKKSIFVINAKDEKPPKVEESSKRVNCYEQALDFNLYITKSNFEDEQMVYEFPSKEIEISDVVFFINNRYQRRNAVYEEEANVIYLTLNEYMKRQAMREWNF